MIDAFLVDRNADLSEKRRKDYVRFFYANKKFLVYHKPDPSELIILSFQ